MTALADLRDSRELLINLTRREVTGKYKRSALGQGWSLVNPIATLLIYTLVFGLLIRVPPDVGVPSGLENFTFFLACALLPWSFFQNAVNGGMGALLANANLVKKVWFPREVLVASTVLSWVVTFAIELAVLTLALLLVGANPLPFLPVLAVLVALLTFFALGIGLALSVANVYFRDTTHFMAIGMQFWFYLTPVVYPVKVLADALREQFGGAGGPEVLGVTIPLLELYQLNPMARFAEAFRACLYDNRLPDLGSFVYLLGWTAFSLAAGYLVFRRFTGRLAEEL